MKFYFHYCLNKYRELVKLSICLWYTRETFANYNKQNILGVSCCCRLNKENENRITRVQTRACNDVFYTKTYEKELRWWKSYLGERSLIVNSQIFYWNGLEYSLQTTCFNFNFRIHVHSKLYLKGKPNN